MVADEITTTWISKEVFGLVKAGAAEKYVHKEGMSFLTYAEELDSRGQEKKAQNHFRNVCIETTREVLTPQEQDKAEAQYRKLSVEKASIQQQVLNLTKRKMELELELATIRNERMQIDLDSSNSSLSGTKFLDPVTYDILLITEEAKKNLIRTVLGEGLSESDITVLLDKNGIPGSLQEALGLDKMTLFSFGAITEDSFKDKEVPQRERRSVLALAEYVRNRIKECTQEQTKVKFTLERKYLKCQRDLDTCSTTLKSTQKALDHNDDMCIRLQHTLNPPVVEKRLRLVDLQGKAQDKRPKRMAEDFGEIYGFAPILIDTELTDNLKRFGEGWDSELRRHRKIGDEMHGDDDDELLDLGFLQPSVNEIDPQTGHPHIYSVGSIILGAFAIMLKHCTGMDKFLMGVTQSYRPTGLLAGPLTDTVPIKIDLSQKGGTFNTLFHRLSKSMYEGSIYGGSCGMAALEHSTHMQLLLEVRFEFIPAKETDGWLKNGMSVGDLLGQQDEVGEGLERLWTVSEHDPFDMKLTCVEAPTHIIGGITYRKDKYDMTHVTRWIDKLISTLQSIERAPRKVTINSLISRYYQSVWQGGSKENLVGSVQDLNDAHQRLSMVDIFSSQPQIVPDDQESAET
ncbi:uncharacterized protein BJ171DRAFT_522854 [Polychytrium aggregatum]|uniref:uncharacterized protein n=1 Tax=Polychytrium aggregatum TaxID=110093 RepID=UPI0022FF27DE|nr:uncharacterized protein BJ171DRAFT_522854 [Polychytrium aggregatum]KAI9197142.1 hypothetical protein BJ171DRAFT_522854 [Polychytrium aggregatum]